MTELCNNLQVLWEAEQQWACTCSSCPLHSRLLLSSIGCAHTFSSHRMHRGQSSMAFYHIAYTALSSLLFIIGKCMACRKSLEHMQHCCTAVLTKLPSDQYQPIVNDHRSKRRLLGLCLIMETPLPWLGVIGIPAHLSLHIPALGCMQAVEYKFLHLQSWTPDKS